MVEKRKLPARASARQEQAKRRNVATRGRTPTPEPVEPPREPTPPPPTPPPPPPPLPKSIEVGKPLPTVEVAQPKDLSADEYQSLTESGVMVESLSRSRQKWIGEGLFEKFWTKPHKRKGVLQEDPNNPPKDSMMKVGTVMITIEPHIVEATMFAVKTSKLPPHHQQKLNPQGTQKSQQPAQQPQVLSQGQQSTAPQPEPQPQPQPGQQQAQVSPVQGQATAKPAQQPAQGLARPVLQYGPPNGSMPPPPMPTPATAAASPVSATAVPAPAGNTSVKSESPTPAPVGQAATTTAPAAPQMASAPSSQVKATSNQTVTSASASAASPSAAPSVAPKSSASPNPGATVSTPSPSGTPRPVSGGLAAPAQPPPAKSPSPASNVPPRSSTSQSPLQAPLAPPQPMARPPSNPPLRQTVSPAPAASPSAPPSARPGAGTPGQASSSSAAKPPAGAPGTPAPAAKPAANDPVIALLAQKASRDPALRDLMKRVAVGEAKDGELAKFQKIIDQLNAEYRQKGGQQGPSADRLLVDGRTVKYFADEVRTILDIVLASNPNQKSSELRPPPRSDPLVVLLVKTALEDQRTKDMIRRIAEGKPGFNDATDLKQILDRLHRDAKITPKAPPQPAPSPLRQPAMHQPANTPAKANKAQSGQQNPQALRSKGPPPSNRPDISAVVFDFGTGDRYLFPKYSVLEFLPSQSGQQVVASFLIVRKGSMSEYGGDPKLDYYQPVSIRLQTQGGRHLENLARIVAPQDEVRRYMDDVMDNMTRAEYVLLAMRLPREDFDPEQEVIATIEDSKASSPTPKSDPEPEQNPPPKPGVLWATRSTRKTANPSVSVKLRDPEQEAQSKYERLIRAVAEKEVDLL